MFEWLGVHNLFGGFDIHDLISRHGYSVVGGVIGLESMGIPLPGETVLIAAAIYAATTGNLDIGLVVLAAATGAIIGDNLGYLIGRRAGPPLLFRYGPRMGLTIARQRLGQYLFLRHGGKVVFMGRFVAFLRMFAAVLAGANRMPWGRFLMWNGLGGVVWTGLYGFGAYALGNQIHKFVGPVGITCGVVVAVALAWGVLFFRKHEHRLLAEAEVEMRAYEAAVAAAE